MIGKIIFVEAARVEKFFARKKCSRPAGTEDFADFIQGIGACTVAVSPRQPADMIDIAFAIQKFGGICLKLARGEKRIGMRLSRFEQAFKPVRFGEGIGVEQGQPFASSKLCAEVI